MKKKLITLLAALLVVEQGYCGCFDSCFRSNLSVLEEPMETPPIVKEAIITEETTVEVNADIEKEESFIVPDEPSMQKNAEITPEDYLLHAILCKDTASFLEILPEVKDVEMPLLQVAFYGNAEMMSALLERCPDVDGMYSWENGKFFGTPLLAACSFKNVPVAKVLVLEGKADIDLAHKESAILNPLVAAITLKQKELVEFLIEQGARVSYLMIQVAKEFSTKEIQELLEENISRTMTVNEKQYEITNWRKIEIALAQDAIKNNDYEKFSQIIAEFENPENGLAIAILSGSIEYLRCVLDRKPNVNVFYEINLGEFRTPLWFAISEGLEMVQALVNEGAEVDLSYQDVEFATPLSAAIMTKQTEIVQLLLEQGANPRKTILVSGEVVSPLDLAQSNGNKKIVSLIREYLDQ